MTVHGDQTAGVDPPLLFVPVRHPAGRKGLQPRLLLRPGRLPGRVAPAQKPGQELTVIGLAVEVPAAPEPQSHVELPETMAMRRLHVSV